MSSFTLKVVPFENRGGSMSFRVTGMFMGKQVRKNFSTLERAETFKRTSLAKVTQVESAQLVSTRLKQADMPRIESWVEKLGSVDRLGEAVAFFQRFGSAPVIWTPADAIANYAAVRKGRGAGSRAKRKGANTVEVMKLILGKMVRELEVKELRELTTDRLQGWVYDERVSTRTRRDRYSWLVGFFDFLKSRKAWVGESPLDEIERPAHRTGLPLVLSLEQVRKLVELAATDAYAGDADQPGQMLTYFAVCLFTGIRPDEAKKLGAGLPVNPANPKGDRTDGWEFVHFENKLIELPPDLVKVGGVRNVPLHDNALAILAEAKRRKLPFCFFSTRVFNRVRQDAGVKKDWQPDVLRHCYASYHYAVHKDVKFLEDAMGNSRSILFKHYIRRTVTISDGASYATIVPRGWPAVPVESPPQGAKPQPAQPGA